MKAYYVGQVPSGEPGYLVEYLINKTNKRLVQKFSSPYQARKLVNRLRHSKKCTLISYPISCM